MASHRAGSPSRQRTAVVASSLLLGVAGLGLSAQTPYATVFYQSGPLRIEAYVYRPSGSGPFPVVIYNHGARNGSERVERPFPEIAGFLKDAGYAVLVTERRGFGRSDGATLAEELAEGDRQSKLIQRVRDEADDVIAAVAYLKSDPSMDSTRIALVGGSLGGVVALSAASRSGTFRAVVNQAGGAINWNQNPVLQEYLKEAAGSIKAPLLSMVAANDATTAAARAVFDAADAHGTPSQLIIYPRFVPTQPFPGNALGHALITAEGLRIWGRDVVSFLDRYVGR